MHESKIGRGRRAILVRFLCLFFVGLLFFGSIPMPASGDNPNTGGYSLQKARADLEGRRANFPGFAGIAHSDGQIIVFLENDAAKSTVPDSFEGFTVHKIVTGRFKALAYQGMEAPVMTLPEQVNKVPAPSLPDQENNPLPTRQVAFRPLMGGISVFSSISNAWYGTLGLVTYDNKILSCAHVLAINPNTSSFVPVGTTVIQPAGMLADTVGALQNYIPITFNSKTALNYADAAVATVNNGIGAQSGVQYGETGNYSVSGTTTVAIGDTVRKSGATTGVTTGTVTYTNASVAVQYDSRHTAYFGDQIIIQTPSFSSGGDSGSCVDKGGKFVGLVFAGTDTESVVCKASYIIQGLGISVNSAPTVSGINPSSGPAGGGTVVTITGTNLSRATGVKFGTTAGTGLTVNSGTSIMVTSPAGTGTVDVTVTTAGGTSATSAADKFTYYAAPTITSFTPTSGVTGTSVVITGTNLSGATAVKFGRARCLQLHGEFRYKDYGCGGQRLNGLGLGDHTGRHGY